VNILKPLFAPEYLFQPRRILFRLKRAISPPVLGEFETVMLPWGSPLRVRPAEVIGSNIWCYGIFDLLVSEAAFRLIDPGDVVIDVGANIGQMTSLAQHRVGPQGKVFAFEPHPEIFAELRHNIELSGSSAQTVVEARMLALSEKKGHSMLDVGPNWNVNRGMSRLSGDHGTSPLRVRVEVARLDDVLPPDIRVGLAKIDVEGHELNVLKGGERLLAQGMIRDILFEDLSGTSGPVQKFLSSFGYRIFALRSLIIKPALNSKNGSAKATEFLATRNESRARSRFQPIGWKVLKTLALTRRI